jgi:hypothetical protein
MGRPLGRWARDEDGARTGLPFMLWCVRSYIENPEGQYYSTKSRYCNGPSLVTPGVGARYSDFTGNFEHSSNRMPIEQSFGELFARWGIFWRPLRMLHSRRGRSLVTGR